MSKDFLCICDFGRKNVDWGVGESMSENWKKPVCEQFYYEYDRFIEVYPVHEFLFDYLRKAFADLSDVSSAHKDVVKIFIKYFNSKIIEDNPVASLNMQKMGPSYKKIFDYCYKKYFCVKQVPKNPGEIERTLFKNEQDCFKIFECLKDLEKKCEPDENVVVTILAEFRFVGAYSRFVYANRNVETLSFFRRFLMIYPFEEKKSDSEDDREWREKHKEQFEKIKQDKNSEMELANARRWYAEQLKKIDFEMLSEEEKAQFFTEAFVAFGNISSAKSGGIEGFVPELKSLLCLGRYYNIHLLPFKFAKWTKGSKEEKMVAYIAHETWRRCCGYEIACDESAVNKAKKEKVSKIVIDSQFGKKARRYDVNRLMTQQSSGELFGTEDNFSSIMKKLITNAPVTSMALCRSVSEGTDALICSMDRSNLMNMVRESIPNEKRGDFRKLMQEFNDVDSAVDWRHMFPILPMLYTLKYGFGIFTHYDCCKMEMNDSKEIREKIVQQLSNE